MLKNYFAKWLLWPLLCFCCILNAQNFGDKSYYLVDSIIVDELSQGDKILIDSLLQLYHNSKSDTIKINCISKITEDCWDDNVWPKYNSLILQQTTKKLKEKNTDKIQIFLKKHRAGAINNLGFMDYSNGKIEECLKHYQASLTIFQEVNDREGQGTCFNNIASVYEDMGEVHKAIVYYNKFLKISKELNDNYSLATAYNNLGYIYGEKGEFSKALEYYTLSRNLLEELDDKYVLGTTINNIAYIYRIQGEKDKALNQYFKAIYLFEKINNEEGIAGAYNNVGLMYKDAGNHVDAVKYFQKSLAIFEKQGNKKGIADIYNSLGVVSDEQGLDNEALDYFNKSYAISTEVENVNLLCNVSINLGRYYFNRNNFAKAKEYLLNSYKVAKESGYLEIMRSATGLLSSVYQQQNDAKNEVKYYRLHVQYRDSVQNENNKKAAIRNSLEYNFEKAALADSLKNAEEQRINQIEHDKEISDQRIYTLSGGIISILMLVVLLIIFKGYKDKKKSNAELGIKNKMIEEKNREITDSITYAKRIQNAILPSNATLNEHLGNEGFVLYKPKDIVAGDFYWLQKIQDQTLYGVADCTGHGVPGAMVSVVCHNALNRAVRENQLTLPGEILDKTKEIVIETFAQNDNMVQDGMDVALCSIDRKNGFVNYAGANNPIYVITDNSDTISHIPENARVIEEYGKTLFELKANKQPIGNYIGKNEQFTTHKIKVNTGDVIYTFTDGFADQFGGEKGKKLKYSNFKKLLLLNSKYDLDQQKIALNNFFEDWKDGFEQIDDVCIIGLKV